jgi:hypothetical protein
MKVIDENDSDADAGNDADYVVHDSCCSDDCGDADDNYNREYDYDLVLRCLCENIIDTLF